MESNEFISPEQLETEFGISAKKQNYLRSKRYCLRAKYKKIPFPFYKVYGIGIRYKRSEIIEWIEKQKMV